jgi:hypothetical protein
MAISHELSTEIATALLTGKKRSPRELHDLKKMLLEIHSTLERLTEKRRHKYARNENGPPPLSKALGSSG